MNHPKILPTHLNRQAVIYIRQSSPQQVEHNLESRYRQYQLQEKAQAWGWLAAHCVVIDDDLGISGAYSHNRPGYQRLISLMALREVGIVLGLEVSRLARNSLDWYQLLELAAAFDILIADEDGLYHPRDFNDRLVLGLKGTMSEVELYQIRARLMRGRLSKAQRGELELHLPVGLERDAVTGTIRLAVDQSVRHRLQRVFTLFRQLRTVRAVLRHLRAEGVELPYQRRIKGAHPVIGWRPPSYDMIYGWLTNPIYAGVYCYGKRRREVHPVTHQVRHRKIERSEWEVFLPDHHQGYLTLAEFEENQRILANNVYLYPTSQGGARRGETLLQGLVYCQHCGRKMRVRYASGRPSYLCSSAHQHLGEPICNQASAGRVDALVGELFLTVLNTETLAATREFETNLKQEALVVEQSWRERLQRLEYQADLARRRYEQVDPANRLVAQTLETDWNQRLQAVETARREWAARQRRQPALTTTLAEMKAVIEQLRDYWYGGSLDPADKKELVRCLVESVFLERREKLLCATVNWYGGAVSQLEVPKYLFSTPHIYHRIRELAPHHTDQEIAIILNTEGILTAKNKPWTIRRVMDFRLSNAIGSGFSKDAELRLSAPGYLTSAEAARRLQVSQSTIQTWFRAGLLEGKHDRGQSYLWIRWDEKMAACLRGDASPDPRLISVRQLGRERHQTWVEVIREAHAQGHQVYRLRRGSAFKYYILPIGA